MWGIIGRSDYKYALYTPVNDRTRGGPGGNSRFFVQLLHSRPSHLLQIVDVNAYPSHFEPGSLSQVRLQKPLVQVSAVRWWVTWKIFARAPQKYYNKSWWGNACPLCFIPTDCAPQSAAVSTHILLLVLHDRQCVLRCLQVRTPHIRLSVHCDALVTSPTPPPSIGGIFLLNGWLLELNTPSGIERNTG